MQKKKGIVVIVAVILVVIVGWVWSSNRKVDVLKGYDLNWNAYRWKVNQTISAEGFGYDRKKFMVHISDLIADKVGLDESIKKELTNDLTVTRIKRGDTAQKYLEEHKNSLSSDQKEKLKKYQKYISQLKIKIRLNGKLINPEDDRANFDGGVSTTARDRYTIKNGDKITLEIIPGKDSIIKKDSVNTTIKGLSGKFSKN